MLTLTAFFLSFSRSFFLSFSLSHSLSRSFVLSLSLFLSFSPTLALSHSLIPLSLQLSDMYSTVRKTHLDVEEKESDYSSIAEIKGLVPESSSSDLYATVRDIYPQLGEGESDPQGPSGDLQESPADSIDPGYENICLTKTGNGEDLGLRNQVQEPDYESVGELGLGLNRESSRL